MAMRSLLITLLVAAALEAAPSGGSPIIVLVANGSDITINLSGDGSLNRVLNVVSDSGNNNPSVLGWVGGNGANKAPRLTVGTAGDGGGDGTTGDTSRGGTTRGTGSASAAEAAKMIDALWRSVLAEDGRGTTRIVKEKDDVDDGDGSDESERTTSTEPSGTFRLASSSLSKASGDGTTESYAKYYNKVTPIN